MAPKKRGTKIDDVRNIQPNAFQKCHRVSLLNSYRAFVRWGNNTHADRAPELGDSSIVRKDQLRKYGTLAAIWLSEAHQVPGRPLGTSHLQPMPLVARLWLGEQLGPRMGWMLEAPVEEGMGN